MLNRLMPPRKRTAISTADHAETAVPLSHVPRIHAMYTNAEAVIQAGDMLIAIGSAESLAKLTALARGQAAAVPV